MILMCKDKPVYDIEREHVLCDELLPGIMHKHPCSETFHTWMRYRYSSGTNTIARRLKGITFGQGARNRINRETRAFSFSDCYWIRGDDNDQTTFKQVSPYYADFWDGIGDYAGQAVPTLYVGGALTKEWRRDGRLYKYGNVGVELQCIELCKAAEIPVIEAVAVDGGIAVENLTSPDLMLEQADQSGRLDPDDFDESDILRLFGRDGARMLIMDAIVGNGDRHAGNFGWLRDSITGEYVAMAPLYDFDHAFDATGTSDRLLRDAIDYCSVNYSDEIVHIAKTARKSANEIFRKRADAMLKAIEGHGLPRLNTFGE